MYKGQIGLIGLVLFVLYLKAMIGNFLDAGRLVKGRLSESNFLYRSIQAMQVWLLMNLLFSFASYGLKSYEWYLFGGLSVVIFKCAQAKVAAKDMNPLADKGRARRSRKFSLARKVKRWD